MSKDSTYVKTDYSAEKEQASDDRIKEFQPNAKGKVAEYLKAARAEYQKKEVTVKRTNSLQEPEPPSAPGIRRADSAPDGPTTEKSEKVNITEPPAKPKTYSSIGIGDGKVGESVEARAPDPNKPKAETTEKATQTEPPAKPKTYSSIGIGDGVVDTPDKPLPQNPNKPKAETTEKATQTEPPAKPKTYSSIGIGDGVVDTPDKPLPQNPNKPKAETTEKATQTSQNEVKKEPEKQSQSSPIKDTVVKPKVKEPYTPPTQADRDKIARLEAKWAEERQSKSVIPPKTEPTKEAPAFEHKAKAPQQEVRSKPKNTLVGVDHIKRENETRQALKTGGKDAARAVQNAHFAQTAKSVTSQMTDRKAPESIMIRDNPQLKNFVKNTNTSHSNSVKPSSVGAAKVQTQKLER